VKHALLTLLLLAGCSAPVPPPGMAASGPAFDPVAFFTGHVTSWGVEENRAGQPVGIVTTDCVGTANGAGGIRMVQVLRIAGKPPQTRIWQLRRTSAGTYSATANDMAGTAAGTVYGRALHWRWTLETSPGDVLKNVTMDQWFYRMDDGAVMIRTHVTKFGILLLQVSEQFAPA
jgi:hypothetical protein